MPYSPAVSHRGCREHRECGDHRDRREPHAHSLRSLRSLGLYGRYSLARACAYQCRRAGERGRRGCRGEGHRISGAFCLETVPAPFSRVSSVKRAEFRHLPALSTACNAGKSQNFNLSARKIGYRRGHQAQGCRDLTPSPLGGPMPSRPLRYCPQPGCSALTSGGPCPAHVKQQRREQDARRESSRSRGYGRAWERLRAVQLARELLCLALKPPRLTPRVHVDHILPLARGGTDAIENLKSLCQSCHSGQTAREDGGFGRRPQPGRGPKGCDENGVPLNPGLPWHAK